MSTGFMTFATLVIAWGVAFAANCVAQDQQAMLLKDDICLMQTLLATSRKQMGSDVVRGPATVASEEALVLDHVAVSGTLEGLSQPDYEVKELPDLEDKQIVLTRIQMGGNSNTLWSFRLHDILGFETVGYGFIVKKVLVSGTGGNEWAGLQRMSDAGILIPAAAKIESQVPIGLNHWLGTGMEYYAMAELSVKKGVGGVIDAVVKAVTEHCTTTDSICKDAALRKLGLALGTLCVVDVAIGNIDRLPWLGQGPGSQLAKANLGNVFVAKDHSSKYNLVGIDSEYRLDSLDSEEFNLGHLKSEFEKMAHAEEYADKMIDKITGSGTSAEQKETLKSAFADGLLAQPEGRAVSYAVTEQSVHKIREACYAYLEKAVTPQEPCASVKAAATAVSPAIEEICAHGENCLKVAHKIQTQMISMTGLEINAQRDCETEEQQANEAAEALAAAGW